MANFCVSSGLAAGLLSLTIGCQEPARILATSPIEYLGEASVPGDARDRSGLTGALEDGSPADLLGGFGSAIAWTGRGERYVAAVDRGPADGATTFRDRVQTFDLRVERGAATPVRLELVSTTLLTDEAGRPFTGDAGAFEGADPALGHRLDPEGLRVSPRGTWYVSEEYGPQLLEFTADGRLSRRFEVPARVRIARPARAKEEDLPENTSGRVTNHGFEGLALSPDGEHLFALLQHPLIQDGGRKGVHARLFEVPVSGGATREYVATLDDSKFVFNEIVAVGARRFLAIERDGGAGSKARVKRIVELDLTGATDVSHVDALPARDLPAGIVAARKRTVLDLLDPRFGLAGDAFPEKIEGLCLGPDLADGRHVLVVTSDNDLKRDAASRVFVFALTDAVLGGYVPPTFTAPR